MLVLSRRPGEAVVLTLPDGQQLKVVVGDVTSSGVRLAFDAPRDVAIHRAELLDREDGARSPAPSTGGAER